LYCLPAQKWKLKQITPRCLFLSLHRKVVACETVHRGSFLRVCIFAFARCTHVHDFCCGTGLSPICFFQNHFVDSYYPTIESTFAKSVVYKGVEYDCHIIDTAGQVRSSHPISSLALGVNCVKLRMDDTFILMLTTAPSFIYVLYRMNIHRLIHNMPSGYTAMCSSTRSHRAIRST
jgi:hypothetical protein